MSPRTSPAPAVVDESAAHQLDVRRWAGRIGAVVRGVDLAAALAPAEVAAIEAALVSHKVLFFPGQRLTPDSQLAFAQRLGATTAAHPTIPSLAEQPDIFELDSNSGARANVWHTDVTFVHRPPRASILHAVVIPPVGGDTMWANTEAAYDDLPEPVRELADRAWVVHTNTSDYGSLTTAGQSYASAFASTLFQARHPLVRVHPVSGRRSILLGGFARRVEGLSADESAEVIRTIQSYVTRPENTVRWRWTTGDVVIWDNQATQHYAIDDYDGEPRRVHRVTLVGDAPSSVDGRRSEQLTGDPAAYLAS